MIVLGQQDGDGKHKRNGAAADVQVFQMERQFRGSAAGRERLLNLQGKEFGLPVV